MCAVTDFAEAVKGLLGLNAMFSAIQHLNPRLRSSVISSYESSYDPGSNSRVIEYTKTIEKCKNEITAIDIRKEKKLKNSGKKYIFSPYYLIWDGDCYYMVGYSEKHQDIGNFRVDRIYKQPTVLDKPAESVPEDFDINDYIKTSFRMYNSERKEVELICDNSTMDAVLDHFGIDVETYANDLTSFRAVVDIAVSHVFYAWVFGFGGKMKIKSPDEVKEGYAKMVHDAANGLE